jgi:hypothetical protein
MAKKCFLSGKPIPLPLADENLVSYGDRLLWNQLALQLNGHVDLMLTEQEYVATVCGFYPDALPQNVQAYRNYFNSKQDTMGLRDKEMPVRVLFANELTPPDKKRLQSETLQAVQYFSASDRLSRDELYEERFARRNDRPS